MRIAVNTRFLLPGKMEGFGWYTHEVVSRLVKMHPEHEFYFFFDRKYDPKFIYADNVKPVVLRPAARHPLLFIHWFDRQVRRAMTRYRIDLFFSPDGYLSLTSKVPQVCTIHDINFEHNPKDIPLIPRLYLRYFFPQFAKKAKSVLTVSEYSRQDILKTYELPSHKVEVAHNGASDQFLPLDEDEIHSIRNEYSEGLPYFIFVGALHKRKNLPRLLEAYGRYRDEMENPWPLIIVGERMWSDSDAGTNPLQGVKFTGRLNLNELTKVMGAAGALAYVPYFEGFGIPLVEAMRCGVPILSGNRTSLPEVAGEAAIYCDPYEVEEIKTGLIRLTEDESLRNKLADKGLVRAKEFSWDKTANKVAEVLGL